MQICWVKGLELAQNFKHNNIGQDEQIYSALVCNGIRKSPWNVVGAMVDIVFGFQ